MIINRKKMCYDKISYATFTQAEITADKLDRQIYECPHSCCYAADVLQKVRLLPRAYIYGSFEMTQEKLALVYKTEMEYLVVKSRELDKKVVGKLKRAYRIALADYLGVYYREINTDVIKKWREGKVHNRDDALRYFVNGKDDGKLYGRKYC